MVSEQRRDKQYELHSAWAVPRTLTMHACRHEGTWQPLVVCNVPTRPLQHVSAAWQSARQRSIVEMGASGGAGGGEGSGPTGGGRGGKGGGGGLGAGGEGGGGGVGTGEGDGGCGGGPDGEGGEAGQPLSA